MYFKNHDEENNVLSHLLKQDTCMNKKIMFIYSNTSDLHLLLGMVKVRSRSAL